MFNFRKNIKKIVKSTGYDIVRVQQKDIGINPFSDMKRFLNGNEAPVIFDVGANVGQTVVKFLDAFPKCSINSFEPSPSTYLKLKSSCDAYANVKTWNLGVGSTDGVLSFQENEKTEMSSFLEPGEDCWGRIVNKTNVDVITLDSFTENECVDFIDVLKSDTQGFDFEVFKGANRLMASNKIGMIYFEFIFSDMYKNLPPFHEVFSYLTSMNFSLVTFYDSYYQNDMISWTDALFINNEFNAKRTKS